MGSRSTLARRAKTLPCACAGNALGPSAARRARASASPSQQEEGAGAAAAFIGPMVPLRICTARDGHQTRDGGGA